MAPNDEDGGTTHSQHEMQPGDDRLRQMKCANAHERLLLTLSRACHIIRLFLPRDPSRRAASTGCGRSLEGTIADMTQVWDEDRVDRLRSTFSVGPS